MMLPSFRNIFQNPDDEKAKVWFRFSLVGHLGKGYGVGVLTLLFIVVLTPAISSLKAQPSYTSSNYINNGDTVYLTKAQGNGINFDTTGANISWDYSTLGGNSQTTLIFREPSQTGFTPLQWIYINNPNNVNLSSTDGQTIALGNLQKTDPNDYFLNNNGALAQKASSFKVVINNSALSIKNVYDSPDTIYSFPLNYGDVDSSTSSYSTSIPGLYFNATEQKRTNTIEGYGTIITPYGTYTNTLKVKTDLISKDSIVINDTLTVVTDNISRAYKWLDAAEGYPILSVRQELINNNYITQSVEYLDEQQFFAPNALFAYLPVSPSVGDTVIFQNLSTNSISYEWDFDDPSSGSQNNSSLQNPSHIFSASGTYQVQLIAHNGPYADTATIPVNVDVVTATGDLSPPIELNIYPNPVSNKLSIYLPDFSGSATLSIYNSNGSLIYCQPIGKQKELDVSKFENGLYFLNLTSMETSYSVPLVVQH